MVICHYSYLFDKALSSSKDLTVWAAIWPIRKRLEETFGRFFDCHLDIGADLNIAKYSNIARRIFKSVEPSKGRDRSKKSREQQKEVFSGSLFLVTISSSAMQVPLL